MKHKIIQIPDEYNDIMLVGEAPGGEENASIRFNQKYNAYIGKPFIGTEGQYLRSACRAVNFPFQNCLVTNTVHQQPLRNWYDNLSKEVIDEGKRELAADIEKFKPKLIIAIGGKALEALTGQDKIIKYRGSVLPCTLVLGYKVFATIHPGFIVKGNPQYDVVLKMDLRKALDEVFPEIIEPTRNVNIITDYSEALKALYDLCYFKQHVAVDIETAGPRLLSFGIATSTSEAIVIPKELLKEVEVLKAVSEFCASQTPKIYHNGLYDVYYLAYHYKILTNNVADDTMIAQHAIFPTLPKSLAFCSSLYTKQPYWKCLKGESEVLTRQGWKRLDAIEDNIEVMISDQFGNLSFSAAKKVNYTFNGAGIRIKNLRHDCWYTPEHRLLVTGSDKVANSVKTAEKMRSRCNLISAGVYNGKDKYTFIKLLVAIQADASVRWDRNKEVYFYLKKESKIQRLNEICKALNIELIEFPSGASRGRLECQVKGEAVSAVVDLLGPDKDFGSYLLDFDQETLLTFLNELPYWDGWVTHGGHALNYSSNNVNNIEWVATIAHLCGYTAHTMKAAGDSWSTLKVSMKKTDCVTFKPDNATIEFYSGEVYCLTTAQGFFLCRSNGHIFITGNSEGKEVTKDYAPNKIVDWPKFYVYNGKDCCVTYELWEKQQEELDYWNTRGIYNLMMRSMNYALLSQMTGLNINWDEKKKFEDENERAIEILERIKEACIGTVNLNSPKQVCELLYEVWRLPERKNKGSLTSDDKAITSLETLPTNVQHLLGLIQKVRSHVKLRGFYNIDLAEDGKMHWSNKITGTTTGRWSTSKDIVTSSGLNIQNQPRGVRVLYQAPKGKIFLEWDLSNVDARFVAALCEDENWLNAFDIIDQHSFTAINLFKLQPFYGKMCSLDLSPDNLKRFRAENSAFLDDMFKKVKQPYSGDKSYRDYSKKAGHATHYLEGPNNLSIQLGCSIKEARQHIEQYKVLRPKLESWHNRVRDEVGKSRIIRTCFGRVIQFFGPFFEQQLPAAVAAEPQSCAGDYLMTGGLECLDKIPELWFNFQVHDSINTCVDDDVELLKTVMPKVKEIAEFQVNVRGLEFKVPIEFKLGYNWGQMKTVKSLDKIDEVYRSLQ